MPREKEEVQTFEGAVKSLRCVVGESPIPGSEGQTFIFDALRDNLAMS